ncbi:MAG: protoporphyrinogen oxidase, partial [Paludibacteraceae bacterium]|nr:protoporphyrinogen oxidase [Paludibacteraceae bacterium]
MKYDTVVIGAGITGMTCAYQLTRAKKNILVLESRDRVGGQMHTVKVGDFTFEEGPSTSVVKYPEVAELFEQLGDSCQLEVACESSKRRLIWKGDRFHELPSGLVSAIRTPLFSWCDKIRILMEPWRKKGNNPNESVGELAQRRLGKSYVDYAVDPFMSGVYAGDPNKLPTRLALPKLYNLEQEYGSFIRGSIAKAKLPKTERDKKASKKLFSVKGGFVQLISALEKAIGSEHIITSASGVRVMPSGKDWSIAYSVNGEQHTIEAGQVVTTCGAYALPEVLPF